MFCFYYYSLNCLFKQSSLLCHCTALSYAIWGFPMLKAMIIHKILQLLLILFAWKDSSSLWGPEYVLEQGKAQDMASNSLPFGRVTSSDIVLGQHNLVTFGSLLVPCFASSKHINYSKCPHLNMGRWPNLQFIETAQQPAPPSAISAQQQQQVPYGSWLTGADRGSHNLPS